MKILFIVTFILTSTLSRSQINPAKSVCPILVGTEIPDGYVYTLEGDSTNFKAIANKPTVLVFYRGGWCPYCKKHLSALQEAEEAIKAKGYKIVAITPDHFSQIPKTINKKELGYELYSDNVLELANQFGIAYKMDENTIKNYDKWQLNVDTWQQSDQYMLPVPAVFIIKDGIITFSYVNPDYKTRLSANTLINLLE
jgi:peroxiredoxin